MPARRIHATIMRKRVARAVLEAALVAALLVPWALILAWLFGANVLR